MSNPSISVIVPVYSVAPYIEKCARSLFEQTLEPLEIIFVDDCTPDNSIEIIKGVLEEYPHRKALTQIIKQPSNSGVAGVRRRGILACRGEYIIHCDGDDWIDVELYEKMYLEAVENFSDIVVCDEIQEYQTSSIPQNIDNLPKSGKDIIKNFYKYPLGMFCHNKLVRRELYFDNNILPWEGLNMWEDMGLFFRLFYYADRVSQIHGPVYHYNRANVSAMTKGYGIKQVNQMIEIAERVDDFYSSKVDYCDFEKSLNVLKYLAKLNLITDSFKNYKRFKSLFPESNKVASKISLASFSKKGRLRYQFVKYRLAPVFILLFKIKNLL
ncbi:MAG: glycosyltransferase family 2 protein [Muribaculaceae bacterium]|nr:glycosyltransferase family 2 protein [Muribaculaceae bacterium]